MSELFTSGETRGLTQIPSQTIRRYTSEFKPHFSEGVQKSKGRRYNSQDINNLLIIRKLKASHTKNETIILALKGEGEIPNIERIDHSDALKIVDAARKELREIRAVNLDCWKAQRKAKELTGRFERSLTNRDMIPTIIERLDNLENKINKFIEEMTYKELNKGFLARILGA